jgi:hypothetical protein
MKLQLQKSGLSKSRFPKSGFLKSRMVLGLVISSILFNPSVLFSASNSAGVKEFDYSGSASRSSSGGWASSLKNYATKASRTALSTLNSFKPLAKFIVTYPKNFLQGIRDSDYADRKFTVYQDSNSRREHENYIDDEMTAETGDFGADGSYGYRLEYDFGFEGAGDINQPIGFRLVDGKYYYRPVKGQFVPRTLEINGVPTPVDLHGSNRMLKYFMFKSLTFVLGSKSKAKKLWKGAQGVTRLTPQQVFLIRSLVLFSSGARNSSKGQGYPRFGHIPTELIQLFTRIAQTPDIKKTVKANPGVKRTSQWKKVEMVNVEEMMQDFVPDMVKGLVGGITLDVEEGEVQEMKDRKGKPPSDMQKLYAEMRIIPRYNDRTKFAAERLLNVNYKSLNQTDRDLYQYTVRRHIGERFRGLRSKVVQYVDSYGLSEKETDGDDVFDDEDFFDSDDNGALKARAHLGNLTGLIESRVPPLKDFLKKAVSKFKQEKDLSFLAGLLNDQRIAIEREVKKLQGLGGESSVAEANKNENLAVEKAKELERYLIDLQEGEDVELGERTSKDKMSLKLYSSNKSDITYLALRAYQFNKAFFRPFRGDGGYVFDDTRLGRRAAIEHALAIFIRSARDLAKAESLFKNDPREYVMVDIDGAAYRISGQRLYSEKMDRSTKYLASMENNLAKVQAEAGKGDGMADVESALKKAQYAAKIYSASNSTWKHFLRQYPFDRRMKYEDFQGESAVVAASGAMLGIASKFGVAKIAGKVQAGLDLANAELDASGAMKYAEKIEAIADGASSGGAQGALKVTAQEAKALSDEARAKEQVGGSELKDLSLDGESADSENSQSEAKTELEKTKFEESEKVISKEEEAGIYAKTIEEFIGQEVASLLIRSKDFTRICRLYLDQMLQQSLGMSSEEVLQMGKGQQGFAEDEFNKRFDSGFDDADSGFESEMEEASKLEGMLGSVNVSLTEEEQEAFDKLDEDFDESEFEQGKNTPSTAEQWKSYDTDLPDSGKDSSEYMRIDSAFENDGLQEEKAPDEKGPAQAEVSDVPRYEYTRDAVSDGLDGEEGLTPEGQATVDYESERNLGGRR